jgi:maltooligosyltrehalose trehalohydrolase
MRGERLASLVSFESLKLAAGAVMLAPFIPLIFMGEEYAEDAPFCYFISHSDPQLLEAVSRGRKNEFKDFSWQGELPEAHIPDTFARSKIVWEKRARGHHRTLLAFYRRLIRLRKIVPALAYLSTDTLEAWAVEQDRHLFLRRWYGQDEAYCIFNFSDGDSATGQPLPPGRWELLLDSADAKWDGPGRIAGPPESRVMVLPGNSFRLYIREG